MPEMSDKAAKLLYEIVRAAASGNPPTPRTEPWEVMSEEDRDAFRRTAQLIAEAHGEAGETQRGSDDD